MTPEEIKAITKPLTNHLDVLLEHMVASREVKAPFFSMQSEEKQKLVLDIEAFMSAITIILAHMDSPERLECLALQLTSLAMHLKGDSANELKALAILMNKLGEGDLVVFNARSLLYKEQNN